MIIGEEMRQRALEVAIALARAKSETGCEGASIEVALDAFISVGAGHAYIDQAGNAVLELVGKEAGPTLLIDGHADSIPLHSAAKWTFDPFGGEVNQGRLYGLGICDQKASIAAMAVAAQALVETGWDPKGTLVLVASASEEQMEGVALRQVLEKYKPDFAITTEPTDAKVFTSQRGRAKIEMKVNGRPCHAGHSALGINAVSFAAGVVHRLATQFPRKNGSEVPLDLNCIDFLSDPYPSVSTIPGGAIVRFDARFGPTETRQSLLGYINDAVAQESLQWSGEVPEVEVDYFKAEVRTWKGFEAVVSEFADAWNTPVTSAIVTSTVKALDQLGFDVTLGGYSFCTNGSIICGELGIPTIGFGVGDENGAHRIDENVTLDSLARGTQGLASIMAEVLS